MDIAGIWNAYSIEARQQPQPQPQTQKVPQHGVIRTSTQRTQTLPNHTDPYYLPYHNHGPGRFTPLTPPPPSPPPVADAFTSMFGSTVDRIQKEINNLRDMCNNTFFKEQQETKRWKKHSTLARERVKKLTAERSEYRIHAGDGRPSPLYGRQESRSHSPIPSISKRSSSRRNSASTASHSDIEEPPKSSSSSSSAGSRRRSWDSRSSSSPLRTTPTPVSPDPFPDSFPAEFPGPLLPPPLLLPPAELDPLRRSHSTGPVLMSTPYCVGGSSSSSEQVQNPLSAITLQMDREVDRANLLKTLRLRKQISLRQEHIDILYVYADREFHCQACRINQLKATSASNTQQQQQQQLGIAVFPAMTDKIDLFDHYLREHPKEAHEIAQLQPAGVAEVRQQLKRRGHPRPYSSCPSSPCHRKPMSTAASIRI